MTDQIMLAGERPLVGHFPLANLARLAAREGAVPIGRKRYGGHAFKPGGFVFLNLARFDINQLQPIATLAQQQVLAIGREF